VKKEKKVQQHYLKMCALAIGTGAIRQFFIMSPLLALLNLAVYTYIFIPVLENAEKTLLRDRKIDGYMLFFFADMMILTLSQYLAAAIGVSLFHISKTVVSHAQGYSKKKLFDVFEQQQPQSVWLLKDNVEIQIPLSTVKHNDIIVIKTGDIVPVDGIVTEGMASIDQHALTGEARPVEKLSGDQVFAATIVIAGRIYVKVEKSGQETNISKINQILNRSIDFKTNFQLQGEKWADMWVLPILGIALLSLPILGAVGFVVILSTHISHRIRITGSLGTLNYINVASHKSVLIKDGRALEALNKIDVVLFDKTGTLTHQQHEVMQILVCNSYKEEEILIYAAAAERCVAHPIAKAILKKAEEAHCTIPLIKDKSKYQIGYGITVNLEDKIIHVGSVRFMVSEGISLPTEIEIAEKKAHLEGHSLVIVAVNHHVGGAIELQTMVRSEVTTIIAKLRQTGVKHIGIVSGDHKHPTQKLAKSLGMDSYYYDVTPENKADIVEKLQKQGKSVCFIGDGINDAIAMKKANVSISIQGATFIATDVADIVLMDGTLVNLPEIFEISKNLESNLQNSLKLSIVPGIIKIGGLLLFNLGILASILIDVLFFFITVGNSMLPLIEIEHIKKIEVDKKLH
jgi:Cu2+-exporting ATPase